MLMDENELAVFKDKSERNVFREIIDLYYSRNFRSSIVSLYSLVIYDLFLKLNHMSDIGNKKAKTRLSEINESIKNPETHYSDIEKSIVQFFLDNYSSYFNKFSSEIDYLTNLRHKCAHLYLNDNELFIPSQSQTKMLIESMYDNLFKVDAPFIDDLFSIIKDEIDDYDSKYVIYLSNPTEIREKLVKKYYASMIDQSINKTIDTLFKLIFVSQDEEANRHINGMYVFLDSLFWYCERNNKFNQVNFSKIENIIVYKMEYDAFSDIKTQFLVSLGHNYQAIKSCYSKRDGLIDYIKKLIPERARRVMHYYNYFSTQELIDLYIDRKIHSISDMDYDELYKFYVINLKMNSNDFFKVAFKTIGVYNSFSTADVVTGLFMKHFDEISQECFKEVLDTYNLNSQCYRRDNNNSFVSFIKTKMSVFAEIDFKKYKNISTFE